MFLPYKTFIAQLKINLQIYHSITTRTRHQVSAIDGNFNSVVGELEVKEVQYSKTMKTLLLCLGPLLTRSVWKRWLKSYFLSYYMCKLPERARWTKSRAVIDYPSRQDIILSSFLRTIPCVVQEKPWNKSFIDQACSVKMAGCCRLFMDLD